MNSQSLILSPGLRALFASAAHMRKVEATIATNLEYAQFLEYGTKKMAAHAMLAPYLADYRDILEGMLRQAFEAHPGDPARAAEAGVKNAVLVILGEIANHSAVNSGRLKNSWYAILANGKRLRSGRPMTAEQARLKRLANARKRRKKDRKARDAAARAAKKGTP